MINFKQEQLIEEVLNYVKQKFPEIRLLNITESPEDPESLWIRVTSPEDEDRRTELISYSCNKTMDILTDYGYHILVMPLPEPARNRLSEPQNDDYRAHLTDCVKPEIRVQTASLK